MAAPTDEQKARERAIQDLEDIETLKGTPAFARYFERRVLGMLETHADKILHDRNLNCDQLFQTRLEYLAMRDVSLMLVQDEASIQRQLGQAEGAGG